MSLNLWKAVLPRSRIFNLTINKTLRDFFTGLGFVDDFRNQADNVFLNLDPQKTNDLEKWEDQFYLRSNGLTEQERRDILEATWKLTGGQSPGYLQSILRSYGFDVYVHDWWQPDEQQSDLVMGSDVAFMGDQYSFMAANFGVYPTAWDPNVILPFPYYPLVNKVSAITYSTLTMGSQESFMGSELSFMGEQIETAFSLGYPIPTDPIRWKYFIYVAGETIPNPAYVSPDRKNEFEELILSIFPADKWVGVIVEYDDNPPGYQDMLLFNDRYDLLSQDYTETVNNMVHQ